MGTLSFFPSATRSNGGFIFAEHPDIAAPEARILWQAELDPGALIVDAMPVPAVHPDAVDMAALRPWLTLVIDEAGEHAVLSDGWHHIRIDVQCGSLSSDAPVLLHYRLRGIATLEPKLLPLHRLVDLYRRRRFSVSLYPRERRIERWMLALRVHDAVAAGATQREIARVLFGRDPAEPDAVEGDSLRSRVRRLVREARRLATGGYRGLMRERPAPRSNQASSADRGPNVRKGKLSP